MSPDWFAKAQEVISGVQYPHGGDCQVSLCQLAVQLAITAQGGPGKAAREAWGQIQLSAEAVGQASVQLSVSKPTMYL